MGGEESLRACSIPSLVGLPPRGRGRVDQSKLDLAVVGITPAWAGKSFQLILYLHDRTDYPRVGGEEGSRRKISTSGRGLPPRGRGRGTGARARSNRQGITPAWAGKSRAV